MQADNPSLKIFWQNRYAPAAGLFVSLAVILQVAPTTLDQRRLQIWAVVGVTLTIASLVDVVRPGFRTSLMPDGLPLSLHLHSLASGCWIGGAVWVDLEAAATNEFAYLVVLLILGTMLGLLQFGTLGWHTPILMTSSIATATVGLGVAVQWPIAIGSIVLLGVALRASLASARIYAELLVLRAESQDSEATATWFANHDPLTEALNRRGIGAWLESPDADPSFCLFVDLDHFKMINDTFGHGVGDDVLLATAATLSSLVGSDGAVGRLGGDEFVALLDSETFATLPDAEGLGLQLLAALRTPFGDQGPMLSCRRASGSCQYGTTTLCEISSVGETPPSMKPRNRDVDELSSTTGTELSR